MKTILETWQERLYEGKTAFADEIEAMDRREKQYAGDRQLRPLAVGDRKRDGKFRQTSHVRNITFENIESQVSTSIPMPKVTARRKADEKRAERIEHFLRGELDRMDFEAINDMAERTVPLQGGAAFLVEWDNDARKHGRIGEISVSLMHPKQFVPQPGVFTSIDDMDWFIFKVPTTKSEIRRVYGVDVSNEGESEPDVRDTAGGETAKDAVTKYVGYAKNADGGIDRYVWVNDIELEDIRNYQARRQPVCKTCGRVRPLRGQIIGAGGEGDPFMPSADPDAVSFEERLAGRMLASEQADALSGTVDMPGGARIADGKEPDAYRGDKCPYCGGTSFTDEEAAFERVIVPITTEDGLVVPGARAGFDEDGRAAIIPTLIPFYKPDVYPIVLQRSVSVYGQLLGNSDADVIADQQNTVNRLEQKIIDRIVKAGSRITLPNRTDIRMDTEDSDVIYIKNAADKELIGTYDFTGNLQYEMAYLASVYEEARQVLGITDSFQGRRDTTATSGKAKEFSAAQAAGRLESKRVMKEAAYGRLFEMMFKFFLAYSDEPRVVTYKDYDGNAAYETFSRYDFLEKDENGDYYWNDDFLFSCETSGPLASNREAMWQETRLNLQTGAFGDPADPETLLLFWEKMQELHYPGAGATKAYLERRIEEQKAEAARMQAAQMQMQAQEMQMRTPGEGGFEIPAEVRSQIEERARAQAARDSAAGGGESRLSPTAGVDEAERLPWREG